MKQALRFIVRNKLYCIAMVDDEAIPHRFDVIVVPLDERCRNRHKCQQLLAGCFRCGRSPCNLASGSSNAR